MIPLTLQTPQPAKLFLGYLTIVAFVTALGLAGAVFLARLIVKPLSDLRKAAEALGKGENVSFQSSILDEIGRSAMR